MYGLHVGGEPAPCACKVHAGDDGSSTEAHGLGVAPTLLLAAAIVVGAVAYRRHRDGQAQVKPGV